MKKSTAGTVISFTNNVQISPVFPLPLPCHCQSCFITRPVSFPAPVTTSTLVSFATSPPIPIQTFPLSRPPVSLPILEPVPSGSSSQQLQWFPTAEESPTSVSLGPSSPAETLIQPQGVLFFTIGGALASALGYFITVWPPYEFLSNERLKMIPGLPPYEWWKNPPDKVLLRVYVFNITNAAEFQNGTDSKIKLQEVGPYVFLEKLYHTNVTFSENSTMTYVARRTAIFQPELNHLSLNDTLVLPNIGVLGIASYLHDPSFLVKFSMNMIMRKLNSQPFVHLTVNDYFWNNTDPLISLGRDLLPFMVPDENLGILNMIYKNFTDEVTVHIGPQNAERYFTMDRFHGRDRFGFWDQFSCDTVKGATEGISYHQNIKKNDTLLYFRKTICRVATVYYVGELNRNGIHAYHFELPNQFFNRSSNKSDDCFSFQDYLPSGVSDASPCYYDFPIATSFPHFLNGDKILTEKMIGLKPNRSNHQSFVIVEPKTGVPMESCARSQSNLVIRNVDAYRGLRKFSNLIIPMFWAEYKQNDLPNYIFNMLYFTVVILPPLQTWLAFWLVLVGCASFLSGLLAIMCNYYKLRNGSTYSSLELIPSFD